MSLRPPYRSGTGAGRWAGLVEAALGEALARRPELLTQAVGTAAKGWLSQPFALLGRAVLGIGRLFSRVTDDGQVLAQLLIQRSTHGVIQHATSTMDNDTSRRIAAMLAYLQQSLRDPALMQRYAQLESLRIEKLTYTIHVGELAILISVIRGKDTRAAEARCKQDLTHLHAAHMVALAAFDPGGLPLAVLPQASPTTAT